MKSKLFLIVFALLVFGCQNKTGLDRSLILDSLRIKNTQPMIYTAVEESLFYNEIDRALDSSSYIYDRISPLIDSTKDKNDIEKILLNKFNKYKIIHTETFLNSNSSDSIMGLVLADSTNIQGFYSFYFKNNLYKLSDWINEYDFKTLSPKESKSLHYHIQNREDVNGELPQNSLYNVTALTDGDNYFSVWVFDPRKNKFVRVGGWGLH